MRKSHLFIVSVTWGVFTKMSSHPSLSGCKRSRLTVIPLWLQRLRAELSTILTVSLLPLLASVCERVSFFVSDLYSLLPASIKSYPTTRRAAMHSNTLVLYLSSYMLSGLDCVCPQTRVKWWYDNAIPLQTCCDFVLVSSACSEWTLIKMMIQNLVLWLIVYLVLDSSIS